MSIKNVFVIREMSYDEAIIATDISPKEAQREIRRHDADWNEFVKEVGVKERYTGEEILGFLGY